MLCLLHSIDVSKANGPDDVLGLMLKSTATAIAPVITPFVYWHFQRRSDRSGQSGHGLTNIETQYGRGLAKWVWFYYACTTSAVEVTLA